MRFLDTLGLYLNEDKENYTLYPVDYDLETGVSFGVDDADSDKTRAKIIIKKVDGTPVDALGGNYKYSDVYVDIRFDGDIDDPNSEEVVNWMVKKIMALGYDQNTVRVDGDVLYKNKEAEDELDTKNAGYNLDDLDSHWDTEESEDDEEPFNPNVMNDKTPASSDNSESQEFDKDKWRETVLKGVADKEGVSSEDVDEEELMKGVKIEMEHTNDVAIATDIALDHLAEYPDYYTRLEKMEFEAEAESEPRPETSDESTLSNLEKKIKD